MTTDPVEACVVTSVLASDARGASEAIRSVSRGVGLIEIRADHLSGEQVAGLVRQAGRPVVVTVRRPADGGRFQGSEEERVGILSCGLGAGARFVDVEFGSRAADWADEHARGRVILSHHGSVCETGALRRLCGQMAATRAERLKIVPRAVVPAECLAVREVLADVPGRRLACFASGRAGALSRLLACGWGSWATYGAVRSGAETAEGQFVARDLVETYDVLNIGPGTRRFGLIGREVFSSPSPAMHRAGYAGTGVDAVYLPIEMDDVDALAPLLGPGGVAGIEAFGVTLPFKHEVAARASLRDEVARASSAVNTVLVRGRDWLGHNTDGPAAVERVERHVALEGARVAILGAGGTAASMAVAFRLQGARVTLFTRSRRRGGAVARRLRVGCEDWSEAGSADWDVLVNATPLGRSGARAPLEFERSGARRVVLDAAYAPGGTPLVRGALAAGVAVIDGVELLAAQAVGQFAHMTGRETNQATLWRAARDWLDRRT